MGAGQHRLNDAMHLVLIDISNTRTKIACSNGAAVGDKFSLPTQELTVESLRTLLDSKDICPTAPCIACSVVPDRNPVLSHSFSGV